MTQRPRPPRWGDERWYHDVIPVLLGIVVLGLGFLVFFAFLNAGW